MERLLRVSVIAGAAALLFAGCGGDDQNSPPPAAEAEAATAAEEAPAATTPAEPPEDAEAFVQEMVEAKLKAQYGKVWAALHPAYQQMTTRTEWEACQRADADGAAGIKVKDIEVLEVYDDPYDAPEIGSVDAVAVTTRLTFTHPLLEGEQQVTDTDTLHLVNVGGEWKGLFEADTYQAYKAGRCPDT